MISPRPHVPSIVRRFAIPLAAFVAANGALVLFDLRRLSDMKGDVAAAEARAQATARDTLHERAEKEKKAADLAYMEELYLRSEKARISLQESLNAEPAPFPPPRKAAIGHVRLCSTALDLITINLGREAGSVEGIRFAIFRGETYIASGLVKEVGENWSALALDHKAADPQPGDFAVVSLPLPRGR